MKKSYLITLFIIFSFSTMSFCYAVSQENPPGDTKIMEDKYKDNKNYYAQMCYRKSIIKDNNPNKIITNDSIKLQYDLAFDYISAGQDKKAIEVLNQIIAKNANAYKAHFLLGIIYAKNNNEEAAINILKKVVEFDSKNPDAHYALGLIYLTNNKKLAFEEYKTLFDLDEKLASKLLNFIFK